MSRRRARSPSGTVGAQGVAVGLALVFAVAALLVVHRYDPHPTPAAVSGVIRVVAAENFWGSLAAQLGGDRVNVLDLVSDPNADPHEVEANTSDAIAIADARLVIENGAGYDDWCQQLVSASASPGQVVLNVAQLLGKAPGDNPHFWYGSAYVNATLSALYADLVAIDPANRTYFSEEYYALNASLAMEVYGPEASLRAQFAGTPVAATESLFSYLAESTGLDLVSPPAFMNAVSEGNDPPASSITQFDDQLIGGSVELLVYNEQTVTPLTQQLESLAIEHGISVVGITEIVRPPGLSYQSWLNAELVAIESALHGRSLGP